MLEKFKSISFDSKNIKIGLVCRLKEFRILQNVIPNTIFPKIGAIVRVIAALCNAFRNPLRPKAGPRDDSDLDMLMKTNFSYNPLEKLVKSDVLRTGWHK